MTENQYQALIRYIDAASSDAIDDNLHSRIQKNKAEENLRKELLNNKQGLLEDTICEDAGKDYIIKSLTQQHDISLGLLENTSQILCKRSGESVCDAAHRVMNENKKIWEFLEKILDEDDFGAVTPECVRKYARNLHQMRYS